MESPTGMKQGVILDHIKCWGNSHGSQDDTASAMGVKLVQANNSLDQSYPSLKLGFKGAGMA